MATLNWKTPNGTTGSLDLANIVTSVTTGSTNGTIAVNGTNVAVKGLGSAAYTASTAYAASSHTHSYLPLSGGTLTGHLNLNNVNLIVQGTSLSPSDTSGAYKTLVQGVDTNSTQIGVVGIFESDARHYATMRAFRGERYIGVTAIADSDATGHIAAQISNLTYNYTAASNALIRYAYLKDFVGDYGGVSGRKKAVNGYIVFKDGIIMQWGQVDFGTATYKDVTPAISFSTIYSVVITDEAGESTTTYNNSATFAWCSANAPSKIRLISDKTGVGIVRWFAVGI